MENTPQASRLNRKDFIHISVAGIASMLLPKVAVGQTKDEKPPALKIELVKEFVGLCHSNITRVKEMLDTEPQLLHASTDWGGGDFESGIEAAGHVGNKEIATYLLSKGARYNVYLASMLGHLDVVKSVLDFNNGLLNSKGPHGFTLLHHANKGQATAVIEYLKSLGAEKTKIDFYAKA